MSSYDPDVPYDTATQALKRARAAYPSSLTFPLGPAEPYAWPGGYPIGYLVDDSEYLCAQCVNDPSNPVHAGGDADGWRLEGLQVLEGSAEDYDGPVYCAHCGRVLVDVDRVIASDCGDDLSGRGLAI